MAHERTIAVNKMLTQCETGNPIRSARTESASNVDAMQKPVAQKTNRGVKVIGLIPKLEKY